MCESTTATKPRALLVDCHSPDYGPISLALELHEPLLQQLRDIIGKIRAGMLGDVRNLAGVELAGQDVIGTNLEARAALEHPGTINCGEDEDAALLDPSLLEEEALEAREEHWTEDRVDAGHIKVDEAHLWLIAFLNYGGDRVVSHRVPLSALGL